MLKLLSQITLPSRYDWFLYVRSDKLLSLLYSEMSETVDMVHTVICYSNNLLSPENVRCLRDVCLSFNQQKHWFGVKWPIKSEERYISSSLPQSVENSYFLASHILTSMVHRLHNFLPLLSPYNNFMFSFLTTDEPF